MGQILHHGIIVTASLIDIQKAKIVAERIFYQPDNPELTLVSSLVPSFWNSSHSFFIAPDGSNEGWEPSDEYDMKRANFIQWLKSKAWEEGSNPYKWVEVVYGESDNGPFVKKAL
jgi:hypothetical protein